ncbi:hypothetical protein BC830DRAFT_1115197, partial [Chytriomyces sp. MP71]
MEALFVMDRTGKPGNRAAATILAAPSDSPPAGSSPQQHLTHQQQHSAANFISFRNVPRAQGKGGRAIKTPSTTLPFQSIPRKQQRNKGKGKYKGPRKGNYGFEAERAPPNDNDDKDPGAIDWRGKPSVSRRARNKLDDEAVRDYMENMDPDSAVEEEEEARRSQAISANNVTKAKWPVSLLVDLDDVGIGGFSSDESEEDDEDSDIDPEVLEALHLDQAIQQSLTDAGRQNDSDSDIDAAQQREKCKPTMQPVKSKKIRVLDFPESGILESLTDRHDAHLIATRIVVDNVEDLTDSEDDGLNSDSELDSLDDEDGLDIGTMHIEGDDDGDGDDLNSSPFKGGKSKWTDGVATRKDRKADASFDQIHNGSFMTSSNKGKGKELKYVQMDASPGESNDNEDDSGPDFVAVHPLQGLSKSAKRKLAKRERKSKKSKDRLYYAALKEEQSRIAHQIIKHKPGDAISPDIHTILHRINASLRAFSADPATGDVLQLPPMPAALRNLAKTMAVAYSLTPKRRGSGAAARVVVYRSKASHVPRDWQGIVGRAVDAAGGVLKGNTWSGKKGGKVRRKTPGAPDDRAAPRPGDVIGEGAKEIGEDNVGHKMMLAMGWKPGDGLGGGIGAVASGSESVEAEETEGSPAASAAGIKLVEPISVTVRAKRRGLGA